MRCTVKDKLQEIIKAGAGTVNIPFIDKLLTDNESSFKVYITPNERSRTVKTTAQAVSMAAAEVERLNKLFHSEEFGVVAAVPGVTKNGQAGIKAVPFQPDPKTARTDSAIYNVKLYIISIKCQKMSHLEER